MNETTRTYTCATCGKESDWMDDYHDRYGIYCGRYCSDACFNKTGYATWTFDPGYAGEALDPEDY